MPVKKFGLKVNSKEAKYTFMSREQNAGQNFKKNKSFERILEFKYLETAPVKQDLMLKVLLAD